MADLKLSALTAVTAVEPPDKLYIVQGTASRRATVQQLIDLILNGDIGTLVDATNDAAAALAGVAVMDVYRNGSVMMIRVT